MRVRDELWVKKPRPRRRSTGQRWRDKRDRVIYLTATHGASQRLLADVFDLSRSRIAAILKAMRLKYEPDR